MSIRLCRWGNSTGLRVPVAVLEAAGLSPGRYVSLRVLDNGDIRVRPVGSLLTAETEGPATPACAATSVEESQW